MIWELRFTIWEFELVFEFEIEFFFSLPSSLTPDASFLTPLLTPADRQIPDGRLLPVW